MGNYVSLRDINPSHEITFTINKKPFKVTTNGPLKPDTTLNTFIREHAKLKGTKNMCLEGGCGSCIVAVQSKHPITERDMYYAVNSCLVTIFSCHEWNITTIEGIGNRKDGYNIIQSRLAELNGTQCGFCSPGMVMNMFSLYESQDSNNLDMKEVENSFGGNICRCTGYRPIADAFKSLSVNADESLLKKCQDIEDLNICWKTKTPCEGKCKDEFVHIEHPTLKNIIMIETDNTKWFKVHKLSELLTVLNEIGDATYMLVGGNTGHGVYRRRMDIQVFIDVNSVMELKEHLIGSDIQLGGNMTLTETMNLLRKIGTDEQEYSYFTQMAKHIDLIANVPVRNIGTIAGNLMLKHTHKEFPSDMFLIFATFNAKIEIMDVNNVSKLLTLDEFLNYDMNKKVITKVHLYPLPKNTIYNTFKIMPRAQNAHALVNAGFVLTLNDQKTVDKVTIVYGAINEDFIHAKKAEELLKGKDPFNDSVLQEVYKSLDAELKPDNRLVDPDPLYRKQLAIALFYKFILSKAPSEKINKKYESGGQIFDRPVSKAQQDFDTDKTLWPLQQPVPKIEAIAQCSGEATYVVDHPNAMDDLYGSFVLARVQPNSVIVHIDIEKALSIPGVKAFVDHHDIPGLNSFAVKQLRHVVDEPIFCDGKVLYNGQPIGLILAESRELAMKAANLVEIEYDISTEKPVLDIRDAIKSKNKSRLRLEASHTHKHKGDSVKKTIKGSFDIGGQYHYTMETQSCVCVPVEDGLNVYPSTQWIHATQVAISYALNLPENKVNVFVRRLGGGYGAKISRAQLLSTACAIAAYKLNKTVHLQMSMENNMEAIGKRFPCSSDYTVEVDEKGKIQYMDYVFYENYGYTTNEAVASSTIRIFPNCYDFDTWDVKCYGVFTDIPPNTMCRSPATTEAIAMAESLMDNIAYEIGQDPLNVRLANMLTTDNQIPDMLKYFLKSVDYEQRKSAVEEFNKNNRWMKKGMHVALMNYPFQYFGNYTVLISVYHPDGTVALTHGGIECGQGVNTKISQVVAYELGIELSMISVKPSNTLTGPNNEVTGGSVTSEAVCYAAIQACKLLQNKLDPIKKSLENPTWQDVIKKAAEQKIDLCTTYMYTSKELKPYKIWGITVSEIEIDVLTGLHQILRVDILEDTGESISPQIDIGQIEGAFVMGIGYWLSENLIYDPNDGRLLTNRTWYYKPPGLKDIPIDFRVEFLKNAPNPMGVLRSKATGEPPLCMSIGVALALRAAIASARKDSNPNKPQWVPINGPTSTNNIFMYCLPVYSQYKLS